MVRDLTGRRFGRLTVICRAKNSKHRKARWQCFCDCKNKKIVLSSDLVNGSTSSCGCLARELSVKRSSIHGMCGTPTYNSWRAAKERCTNKNNKHYDIYGARGIVMCDYWSSSFAAFYADMGDRPEGMTLDRINNDGNYEPFNCRWATHEEQVHNSRKSKVDIFKAANIRWLYEVGKISKIKIGERYGLTISGVYHILKDGSYGGWRYVY